MSPLYKRLPRELRNNIGRYLGLFLLLTVAIAAVSGFLVSAASIQQIQDGMFDRYDVENLHFVTQFKMKPSARKAVETELACKLVEDYSVDLDLDFPAKRKDSMVRLYAIRSEANRAAYFEGREPATTTEIALDRVFCNNNGLSLGDAVRVDGHDMQLVGIMSLSDYECQMEKNTDMIFNAVSFTVAQVTPNAFDELVQGREVWRYDVLLDKRDMELVDRVEWEQDLVDVLDAHDVMLTDLVDYDTNMAIFFAADDVQSDQQMFEMLLYILIVIMALVFVVLTDATIEEESAVIGALLAAGYRKAELIRHYLALPVLIGLTAGVVGNVVGYAFMADSMKDLYYNSYSLPPFEPTFNLRAFVLTTVTPFAMLVFITLVGLLLKLRATPLAFLRHEVGRKSRRANLRLPEWLGFVRRFRLRVFVRNISHFAVLFFGIAFCSIFLLFGLCLMPLVHHYVELLSSDVVAEHLYMLKTPVRLDGTAQERAAYEAAQTVTTTKDLTDEYDLASIVDMYAKVATIDEDAMVVNTLENSQAAQAQAEKFAATGLQAQRVHSDGKEDVTVYGIEEDSRYWNDVDVTNDRVVVGNGLAQKCRYEKGQHIELTDKFTGDAYEFTVADTWGTSSNMNVDVSLDTYRSTFDEDADYFNGYASNEELALDARFVATDISPSSVTGAADQMESSMGSMADVMLYFAVVVYLILIYLLTKTVIDRSARYISYMKVFGYHDNEITKLYVRSITVTVLASLVLSLPLVLSLVGALVAIVMDRYSGNLEVYIPLSLLAEVVAIGAATYVVVAMLHVARIRRVPLSLAMKVQE